MNKKGINKIVEIFRLFPLNPNYIDITIREFDSHYDKVIIHHWFDDDGLNQLEIEVYEFCSITKRIWFSEEEKGTIEYVLELDMYDEETDCYDSDCSYSTEDKNKIDDACEALLRWSLTRGEDNSLIPTLINILPDLTSDILSGDLSLC